MPDVLVIGDILMDSQYWVQSYPAAGGDERILAAAQNTGGSAANTAVALHAQGVACAFHGRVGNDELGRHLTAQMQGLGIDLSCLDVFGETGYTVTMIDPSGERTMFSFRESGGYQPRLNKALRQALRVVRVVYVSGYLLADPGQAGFATEVAKAAKAAGCLVMLDTAPVVGSVPPPVLRGFLAHTDVLLPNRDELFALLSCVDAETGIENSTKASVEEAIRAALELVPCVAVKLGAEGSRLLARPGFELAGGQKLEVPLACHAPAEKATPLDTTGAGDSFNAGFVAAFLQAAPPQNWLAAGNRLAAKVITHRGAVSCYLDTPV